MTIFAGFLLTVLLLACGLWAAIFVMNLAADTARAAAEERLNLVVRRLAPGSAICAAIAVLSFALGMVVAG